MEGPTPAVGQPTLESKFEALGNEFVGAWWACFGAQRRLDGGAPEPLPTLSAMEAKIEAIAGDVKSTFVLAFRGSTSTAATSPSRSGSAPAPLWRCILPSSPDAACGVCLWRGGESPNSAATTPGSAKVPERARSSSAPRRRLVFPCLGAERDMKRARTPSPTRATVRRWGSEGHAIGRCKACVFFNSPSGCAAAEQCQYCHEDHSTQQRPRASKARRDRLRKALEKNQAKLQKESQQCPVAHDDAAESELVLGADAADVAAGAPRHLDSRGVVKKPSRCGSL